jgi:type II secretory pathway component PulM
VTNVTNPSTKATGIPVQTPGRSQFMIAFMVCVGVCAGWYLGVRPMEQKFKQTKAELAAVKKQLEIFDQIMETEPPLEGVIQALSAKGRRTNQAAAVSGNATRLYDAVHDLARQHAVKMARIEPSTNRGATVQANNKGLKGAEVSGYNIEVTGTYESVCRFVDACEQRLGVSKVVSFHLAPQSASTPSKDPIVTGTIETAHLKLQIPHVDDKSALRAEAAEGSGT